eukprot:scaffold55723_cov63-Phaeocystis_antarctica.AAC.5
MRRPRFCSASKKASMWRSSSVAVMLRWSSARFIRNASCLTICFASDSRLASSSPSGGGGGIVRGLGPAPAHLLFVCGWQKRDMGEHERGEQTTRAWRTHGHIVDTGNHGLHTDYTWLSKRRKLQTTIDDAIDAMWRWRNGQGRGAMRSTAVHALCSLVCAGSSMRGRAERSVARGLKRRRTSGTTGANARGTQPSQGRTNPTYV